MKLLVFSDSHGNTLNMIDVLKKQEGSYNHIIHLGDHCTDTRYLDPIIGITPLISVMGNCDSYYARHEYPEEKIVNLYGKQFFICHGHKYSVKQTYDVLAQKAVAEKCDVVLFGHTHTAVLEKRGSVYLFNPGTIGAPSVNGNTYGVIDIENDEVKFEILKV
ncbi:MAG: metallophosphoesterase [Ruminococcaceae bacterium]|nr:metallophosphoesterase [Oscillospiraceae bacterium]